MHETHTMKTPRRRMTESLLAILLSLPLVILLTSNVAGLSQSKKKASVAKSPGYGAAAVARDRAVAAAFAPVFYQGLGEEARSDFITNFDFDGDWRGDNNWEHAADKRFRLLAYVYYAVSETPTHFFVHYAVFHPRDYKGGGTRGVLLSEAIKEGARMGGRYDPTGLSSEAVLAHENDMEGCLVVAAKSGGDDPAHARVVYVETLGHDRFQKYADAAPGFKRFESENGRPVLYVEPKGHGVSAYDGEKPQRPTSDARGEGFGRMRDMLVYRYEGRAGDPAAGGFRGEVGYELLPLYTTLWPRAPRRERDVRRRAGLRLSERVCAGGRQGFEPSR